MWEKRQKSRLIFFFHPANNEGWEKQRLETPMWAQEAMCHLRDVVRLKNSLSFFMNQSHTLVGSISSQVLPPWFRLGHSAYRKVFSCVPFSVKGTIQPLTRQGDAVHPRGDCSAQEIYGLKSPSLYCMVFLKMCSPKSALHQEAGGNSPAQQLLAE